MSRTTGIGAERVEALLRERSEAYGQFFTAEAERLAKLCHKMAERFAREGRLVAFGASPADRSDARHVAVEFVHPVIVGKRALPALGLAGEGGQIAPQVALEAEAEDIAMAFGDEPDILAALAAARERGCLTIAFSARLRRRVGVRPRGHRGPAHPPGDRRDALPHAVGARPHLPRQPRAARGPRRAAGPRLRRVELPLSVPRPAGDRPRRDPRRRQAVDPAEGRRDQRRCARRR